MAIRTGNNLGKRLIDVLGLPENTRRFALVCAVNEAAYVECEYYPDFDDGSIDTMEAELALYRIERIDADSGSEEA